MDGGGAYGAGMAGGSFDPVAFIKKPQVILRIGSWLFSIIVFGCISAGGHYEGGACLYNGDENACNYGIGIGVIAFMACVVFIILDAMFEQISNVKQRRYVVIADMAFSGLWTFLWFVCFCYLADQWRKADNNLLPADGGTSFRNNVQAAIAFSFFSIGTWAGLTVLAVMRYRQGVSDVFSSSGYGDEYNQQGSNPYSSYPSGGETGDPYQAPPFSGEQTDKTPQDQYQPPTY